MPGIDVKETQGDRGTAIPPQPMLERDVENRKKAWWWAEFDILHAERLWAYSRYISPMLPSLWHLHSRT